ncbi:MAG TPA: XdhC family protein [Acidimicrobiales bacterium]|nr:XdhC family protein [Acidimicrobiales bacterium]
MKEVLEPLAHWLAEGKPAAVARVVELVGSGVRTAGAAIALDEAGEVVGSASGGCVEGALVHETRRVLATGGTPQLLTFGCSDDEAFDIGLTCGGTVRALIERLGPEDAQWVSELAGYVRTGEGAVLFEVVKGPAAAVGKKSLLKETDLAVSGSVPLPEPFAPQAARDALLDLATRRSAVHSYGNPGQGGTEESTGATSVFIDTFPAPPRMLIVGAASFTAALAAQAKLLGYRVVVCDARAVFASNARFPMADEVVVDWPDRYLAGTGAAMNERDAICVLTHDPKFDVPTIQAAVRTRAGYIGVMGSRRTQADRRRRLVEAGLGPGDLDRLHGPLGMDIGAASPEETAVSICAEIIARRSGRSGVPLSESSGPVHPGPGAASHCESGTAS